MVWAVGNTAVEEVPEKYRGYFVKRDKNARDTYRALSSNQGSFFEYCDKYCKEILEDNTFVLDKERFIEAFMKSDCRALMELGHPTLLSQAAYDTVKNFIQVDNNNDFEAFRLKGGQSEYKHMQLYWTGWMYAYIHFMSKVCSKTIIEKLPLKEMLIDYKTGHEMSKETYYKKIEEKGYAERFCEDGMQTVLKYGITCYRKECRVLADG